MKKPAFILARDASAAPPLTIGILGDPFERPNESIAHRGRPAAIRRAPALAIVGDPSPFQHPPQERGLELAGAGRGGAGRVLGDGVPRFLAFFSSQVS